MPRIDLTRFGFTPTESLVYEVLLTGGPGTGYAIARSAGPRPGQRLQRAGRAGRQGRGTGGGRAAPAVPARAAGGVSSRGSRTTTARRWSGSSGSWKAIAVPGTQTLVEVESGRGVLQLITHDVARATTVGGAARAARRLSLARPGAPAARRGRHPAGALLHRTGRPRLRPGRGRGRWRPWLARDADHRDRGRPKCHSSRRGREATSAATGARRPRFVAAARLALRAFPRAP